MAHKRRDDFYTEIDQIADKEAFLESVEEGFSWVEDPRAQDNQTYGFVHLLVMILCAILAGANTILDVYDYAHLKLPMFRRILSIEEAPSYNVFWWLLTRLHPKQLETSLVRWVQALPEEDKQKLIAIDGKRLRVASKNAKIHLVSAWDSTRSLLLGQVKVEEKFNEITAILELMPERAGELARSHWSIENHVHWIIDVNFGEDASLASVGNAAENLAALKRLASTMIRIDLGGVRGTAQKRRQVA